MKLSKVFKEKTHARRDSRIPLVAGAMLAYSLQIAFPLFAQTTYFSDDFESYATDANVTGAGWVIFDTATAIEDSTWTVTNPGSRTNPATADGTPSVGNFMISDSDAQGQSNPVDSGASHDLITPSFSTLAAGPVWLHVDVSAQLNNNGAAVFDVDVSTDGGSSFSNSFRRVAPGRLTSNFASTVLPDNTNTDGYFGRLDINLSSLAFNQADVQIRFRHFEPNFDWWIAIDNVVVDDVPSSLGGSQMIFSEDFSSGTLGAMTASGLNTGTETWHTTDKSGRYFLGLTGQKGVNRINHATSSAAPNFAILESGGNPDPVEDEFLRTPLLDLTAYNEVFLHFKSETLMFDTTTAHDVLLSLDGGSTFQSPPIFSYNGGGLFDSNEEPVFADRIFKVDAAASQSSVVFAFRYAGPGNLGFWAVDEIKVTGNLTEPLLGARDWEVFQ